RRRPAACLRRRGGSGGEGHRCVPANPATRGAAGRVMRRGRVNLANLRAAWWAQGALRAARRALASGELTGIVGPAPPPLPARAGRGVEALLRRRPHSCLEAALVRQSWLAAHGDPREVAIGITAPSQGFAAHAWVVDLDDPTDGTFREITRLRP